MNRVPYFKIALSVVLLFAAESAVVRFQSIDFATPAPVVTSSEESPPSSLVRIIDVDKGTPPAMAELHSVVASYAADVPAPKFDYDLGLHVIHEQPMYLGVRVGVSPPVGVSIEGGLGTEVLRTLYRELTFDQTLESLFVPTPRISPWWKFLLCRTAPK